MLLCRCQVIPLVCKAFYEAHWAYPPKITSLDAGQTNPDDLALFSLSSPVLEELLIATPHPRYWEGEARDWFGCGYMSTRGWENDTQFNEWDVADVLLREAPKAPKLRRLVINFEFMKDAEEFKEEGYMKEDSFFIALTRFTKLTSLQFQNFSADPDPLRGPFGSLAIYSPEVKYMSGLQALQEFCITDFDISRCLSPPTESAGNEWVTGLWSTLESIKALRKLDLRISNEWDDDESRSEGYCPDMHFLQAISQLTQIRELRLDFKNRSDVRRDDFMNSASFGALTQLTKLHCCFWTSNTIYQSISSLVMLNELTLEINFTQDLPRLSLALPKLLHLRLQGMLTWKSSHKGALEQILPPHATAFPSLVSLECSDMLLDSFPVAYASNLTCLTSLVLAKNKLERLPAALMCLKNLRALDISDNLSLQLECEDACTLAQLSELQTLNALKGGGFYSDDPSWTPQSLSVWSAIKERIPGLAVIGSEQGKHRISMAQAWRMISGVR